LSRTRQRISAILRILPASHWSSPSTADCRDRNLAAGLEESVAVAASIPRGSARALANWRGSRILGPRRARFESRHASGGMPKLARMAAPERPRLQPAGQRGLTALWPADAGNHDIGIIRADPIARAAPSPTRRSAARVRSPTPVGAVIPHRWGHCGVQDAGVSISKSSVS